ncbi:sulfide/dihydroorotate dehydrogenase-like FAD/NAD-binding protein [Malonomonas rubra]|uniref:sulfide/dihydroorotate dehydrogenase-like FAD/NAD-binding protein n=1 Tax=Malonomonas rubra TaxID=57040 RepID=UPI0026F31058|nr:sulfide/dihydroorotate dehydrogenase-like FAD/NAD-binding protein [Malonomonas rubra]
MFSILKNDLIAPKLHRIVVEAPRIAAARKAGQFVIVRESAGEERIPLTIGDANIEQGTITLFVQAIGTSTRKIANVPAGSFLLDVAGPLGMPTEIKKWKRVVCVGGGVGTAVLYPMAKELAAVGNEVKTIIGGRTKSLIILADELSQFCQEVCITTDDGSLGTKGFVTDQLANLLDSPDTRPNTVLAVGPVPMMRAVAEQTRPYGIHTIVSLNPIMIDGTGMCGGCRVQIGKETKFACVDGPEFDGHLVDFASLAKRLSMYKAHEEACRLLAS